MKMSQQLIQRWEEYPFHYTGGSNFIKSKYYARSIQFSFISTILKTPLKIKKKAFYKIIRSFCVNVISLKTHSVSFNGISYG